MSNDPYALLGVGRLATEAEIKRAYRELARRLHPDRNPDPAAAERLKRINAAYEILREGSRRAAYDRLADSAPGVTTTGESPAGFDDLLETLFGADREVLRPNARGGDIHLEATISLLDALHGSVHRVRVDGLATCSKCQGRGGGALIRCPGCRGQGVRPVGARSKMATAVCGECDGEGSAPSPRCGHCNGEGRLVAVRHLPLAIPQGAVDGTSVRFPRLGAPGRRGAPSGDLVLTIALRLPAGWRREGRDLLADLHLDALDAALGAEIEGETPEGRLAVRVPAGIAHGAEITINGHGLPTLRGRKRGDLRLRVCLLTPRLTPAIKRGIAALSKGRRRAARIGE